MAMLSPVEAVARIVGPVRSLPVETHADLVASLLHLLAQIRSVGEGAPTPPAPPPYLYPTHPARTRAPLPRSVDAAGAR